MMMTLMVVNDDDDDDDDGDDDDYRDYREASTCAQKCCSAALPHKNATEAD